MTSRPSYARDWESLAHSDPLFAVLTDEKYHSDRLTPEVEKAFWTSGEAYVPDLSSLTQRHFGVALAPDRALDFGCGVGRLLLPIARLSRSAVGVDFSPTMLAHADVACRRAALSNVQLQEILPTTDSFDFVNSALVFQHIPVRVGLRLLALMLGTVRVKGLVAIEFLHARPQAGLSRRVGRWLRSNVGFLNVLANLAQGNVISEPYMQMNSYPLGRVLEIFSAHGLQESILLTRSSEGFHTALILARKLR